MRNYSFAVTARRLVLVCVMILGSQFAAKSNAADPAPPLSAEGAFVERRITAEQFKAILGGGFVLYMRHGNTDNSRPDRVPNVDLNDCATQRPLSEEGRALMKQIGHSLRGAGVPLGEILVSPMCRTKESARLAIGDKFELSEALMYSANMTSEEKKPRLEGLRKLMLAPLPVGSNRLLIAHGSNLADLIGFYVKIEGAVLVFRQIKASGYQYVASIHPEDWHKLLK